MIRSMMRWSVLLGGLILCTPASANDTVVRDVHGMRVTMPMPEGFCEISHTGRGKMIRSWLDSSLAGQIVVQAIFVDCGLVDTVDHAE